MRRTSTPARTALHWIVGLLSWALLVYAWFRLYPGLTPSAVLEPLLVVFYLSMIGIAITLIWISHNLKINRTLPPRRARYVREPDWKTDYLGRTVEGPLDAARFAPYVELTYSFDKKVYRPTPITDLGVDLLLGAAAPPAPARAGGPEVDYTLDRGHAYDAEEIAFRAAREAQRQAAQGGPSGPAWGGAAPAPTVVVEGARSGDRP